jgi:hypothetical protein
MNGLRQKWRQFLARPFASLVLYFIQSIFKSGQEYGGSDVGLGIGGGLAILALPGAFTSIILFEKYSTLNLFLRHQRAFDVYAASLPDKYFFIVLSMTITGVVVILKWDRILPDRLDYSNLAPLPISSRSIFLANLTAIIMLAGVFAIDVNAASVFMFPAAVTAGMHTFFDYVSFAGTHAVCLVLASVFTFFACFSVIGAMMAFLPRRWFRRASLYARLLLMIFFAAISCTVFVLPHALIASPRHAGSTFYWLPPVWYLGLYQDLQHRATPELSRLGALGIRAAIVAICAGLALCALSYRRHFMRIAETPEELTGQKHVGGGLLAALSGRMFPGSRFESACYRFILQTLVRSERHSIIFGSFAGVGLVIASQAAVNAFALGFSQRRIPTIDLLWITFPLIYAVVCGLRFVFDVPAELRANWIYRVIVNGDSGETGSAIRNVILTFLIPVAILPSLVIYAHFWGLAVGLVHAACVTFVSLLLIKCFFVRYHKIPFTCSLPPFQNHVILLCFLNLIGFSLFCDIAAAMEHWVMLHPAWLLAVPVVFAIAWKQLDRLKADPQLTFQEHIKPVVERIDLSGAF